MIREAMLEVRGFAGGVKDGARDRLRECSAFAIQYSKRAVSGM